LDAPSGQLIFIVGQSGSGKSTLANLITNAYQAKAGSIMIDDYQLELLDPDWIKEHVSIVPQQSVLFNETLFRNIAFGRKDYQNVTEGEVLAACERCCLFETLVVLPNHLQTVVGVGGKQLSGGQLQRVRSYNICLQGYKANGAL
jgi:ATP-binding cassette subfamily B (MDR/TAP) protein 1